MQRAERAISKAQLFPREFGFDTETSRCVFVCFSWRWRAVGKTLQRLRRRLLRRRRRLRRLRRRTLWLGRPRWTTTTRRAARRSPCRPRCRTPGTALQRRRHCATSGPTDATITTDDTAEGSVAVEELSPSGNTSASVQLTAPGTGGTYYYGACVDAVTDESNTANNCSSSVQVTVRQPTEGVPPFVGVEWLTPGIIDVSDPSWLRSVTYAGRGERILWDHVQQDWVMRNVFLFNVKYEGRQGLTEVQVHPGYGDEASAREQVELYAPVLGRLPRVLLSNAKEVEIQSEPTNPYSATANQAGIFHINTLLRGRPAQSWTIGGDVDSRSRSRLTGPQPCSFPTLASRTTSRWGVHQQLRSRFSRTGRHCREHLGVLRRHVSPLPNIDRRPEHDPRCHPKPLRLLRRAAIRHVSLCASRNGATERGLAYAAVTVPPLTRVLASG